jgi:hypothetical protein
LQDVGFAPDTLKIKARSNDQDIEPPSTPRTARGDVLGAKMFFKGLPESKDRADVIAYWTTLK